MPLRVPDSLSLSSETDSYDRNLMFSCVHVHFVYNSPKTCCFTSLLIIRYSFPPKYHRKIEIINMRGAYVSKTTSQQGILILKAHNSEKSNGRITNGES